MLANATNQYGVAIGAVLAFTLLIVLLLVENFCHREKIPFSGRSSITQKVPMVLLLVLMELSLI